MGGINTFRQIGDFIRTTQQTYRDRTASTADENYQYFKH